MSTGLIAEIYPLSKELRAIGSSVSILFPSGKGSFLKMDLNENTTAPLFKPLGKRITLNHELHESISTFLYTVEGIIIPPVFRLSDLILSLQEVRFSKGEFDAVISFKPWFRTAIPTLKIASLLNIPSVLWLDDYDISPHSIFLKKFSGLTTIVSYLKHIYVNQNVHYMPYPVEDHIISDSRFILQKKPSHPNIICIFPSTGYSESEAISILRSISMMRHPMTINVIFSPFSILRSQCAPSFENQIVKIHFIDWMTRDNYLNFLEQQDIAIVLQPNNNYGKGKNSIRMLECMAKGIPVIAPDLGDVAETIRQARCGLLAKPGDAQSYLQCLAELVSDLTLSLTLGRNGIEFMRKRSWRENALNFLEFLESTKTTTMRR